MYDQRPAGGEDYGPGVRSNGAWLMCSRSLLKISFHIGVDETVIYDVLYCIAMQPTS